MSASPRVAERLSAAAELRECRREAATASLEAFARIYLPHIFSLPWSPMHGEMMVNLEKISRERGVRLGIAAPRGYGKSSIAGVAYVLWSILCREEPFIVLIAGDMEQSRERLMQIRDELTWNEALRRDFPECGGVKVRSGELMTRSRRKVMAVEPMGRIRGRRNRATPPTLVVMDDVETPGQKAYLRARRIAEWIEKWMERDLAPGANTVVIGSIVDFDCLLAQIVDTRERPDWRKLAYAALPLPPRPSELWRKWYAMLAPSAPQGEERGPAAARKLFEANREEMLDPSQAMWPERDDVYALMELRHRIGGHEFQRQMQNDPIEERETHPYHTRGVECGGHYDATAHIDEDVHPDFKLYLAHDPDLGLPDRRKDLPEFAIVREDRKTGRKEALDAWSNRRRIRVDIIEWATLDAARRRAEKEKPGGDS